jgi:hypothetical protein
MKSQRPKRKSERLSIMGLLYLRPEGQKRRREAYVANISKEGIGVYLHKSLRPGLTVAVTLMTSESIPVEEQDLQARVVWCKPIGEIYHAGLRLLDLTEDRYKAMLKAYGFEQ